MMGMNQCRKAVTFSYDDGVLQDERLVAIFNRYGLKATFNVNSGLGRHTPPFFPGGVRVDHFDLEELKTIYAGHEIAVHSKTHPDLVQLSDEDVVLQLEEDRRAIETIFRNKVAGMAYPFGTFDDRIVGILQRLGFGYARTVIASHAFAPQTDLLRFRPTAHHNDPAIFDLIQAFLAPGEDPRILYIWGHSYDFDVNRNWDRIETIAKALSGRADVFYGTNAEVFQDIR